MSEVPDTGRVIADRYGSWTRWARARREGGDGRVDGKRAAAGVTVRLRGTRERGPAGRSPLPGGRLNRPASLQECCQAFELKTGR